MLYMFQGQKEAMGTGKEQEIRLQEKLGSPPEKSHKAGGTFKN